LLDKASLVIKNGRIYTVNKMNPWAQAVAVKGDKIVYVGSNEGLEDYIGSDTKVIDAKNRLVLPGFIDCHSHIIDGFIALFWIDLSSAKSMEEIKKLVKEYAEKHPDEPLIAGYGWTFEAVLSDQGLPRKLDLDSVVQGRPVWLGDYNGHTGLANSKFCELVASSFPEKELDSLGMERDPETGEPTGRFTECLDLYNLSPLADIIGIRQHQLEGLKYAIEKATKLGITSIHDIMVDLKDLEIHQQLRDEGALNARIYAALYHSKRTTEQDLLKFEEARLRFFDNWIKVGAVKLFIDGVPETHTAAMLEPYYDDPSSTGATFYSQNELNKVTARLDKMNFQIITHAIGDRGIRMVLDAYEKAMKENRSKNRRHRIEHVEIVAREDIVRFKQLGLIACMMPRHASVGSDMTYNVQPPGTYGAVVGPERMKLAFPWNSLDKAGAVLAFASDWMVAEMNPLLGIHTALNRGDGIYDPGEAISLEKAIEGYTINAAYASFEEDIKGSIEVGKLADIIVLSENLFQIPANKVKDAEVLLTIVGAKEVYRSDKF
jgi:predicted amidohydrolase YtcJ